MAKIENLYYGNSGSFGTGQMHRREIPPASFGPGIPAMEPPAHIQHRSPQDVLDNKCTVKRDVGNSLLPYEQILVKAIFSALIGPKWSMLVG
jgi:hypothetical protein